MPTSATYIRSEDIRRLLYLLLKNFQGDLLPCFLACLTRGFLEVANYLWPHVRSSVSGQKDFETEALVKAVEAGHVPIVKDLLQDGANPNTMDKRGKSPLQIAAASSSGEALEIVKILVEWHAKVDLDLVIDDDLMPTPLQIAVQKNHFELATFLINEGADPNAESIMSDYIDFLSEEWGFDPYGCRALEVALGANSDIRMIEMLLKAGAEPNDFTLSKALKHDNCEQIFPLLMQHNAPLSTEVLVSAVQAGKIDVVRSCLDAGVDINDHGAEGTALEVLLTDMEDHTGIMSGIPEEVWERQWEMFTLLLERGMNVNNPTALADALDLVAETGKGELVDAFLSRRAHCDDKRVLESAVITEDPVLLERILDAAATRPGFKEAFESSCLGHRALFRATENGYVRATKSLILRGVNLKSACTTEALQRACRRDNPNLDLIQVLLAGGVPINFPACCKGEECLWSLGHSHFHPVQLLAKAGRAEAVQNLLENGAHPNLYALEDDEIGDRDVQKYTSILSSAAEGGHATSVKILLEAGAEVNLPARGKFGRTALQTAAQYGHIDIVELLLNKGAHVNAEPAEDAGVTALQAAAIEGFVGIAVKLIEHGADVNAPAAKTEGRTALEGACEHGRLDMVELLVQAGVDLREAQCKNALVLARKNGFGPVARLLERHREGLEMDELFDFP